MRLTREVVDNAIKLGNDILPKFTVMELAQILDVPLSVMARCVQMNRKLFTIASNGALEPLKRNGTMMMTSGEIWAWYVKNKLKGDEKACFPVQSDQRLVADLSNAKVKIEKPFNYAICTFLSLDKTGSESTEKVKAINEALVSRVVKLARLEGNGQVADRFVFGIILTDAEVAARVCVGVPLYQADWAMEEIQKGTDEWKTISDIPLANPRWVAGDEVFTEDFIKREKQMDDAQLGTTAAAIATTQEKMTESAIAASESMQEQKRGRRTNEQIRAERKRMFDEIVAGGFAEEVAKPILELEKFAEAEKVYRMMLKSLGETPPTPTIPGQQVLAEVADMKGPTDEKRSSMKTLADLEAMEKTTKPTIQDIKTDIRNKAGGAAPAAIEPPKPQPPMMGVTLTRPAPSCRLEPSSRRRTRTRPFRI